MEKFWRGKKTVLEPIIETKGGSFSSENSW